MAVALPNPSFSSSSGQTSLPRIICLHGGGTSARIFQIQTVRIQRQLKQHFRFVFVDAPFLSDPGPGVSPFFDELRPFYRWARRQPEDTGERVTEAIERAVAGRGEGVIHGLGDSKDTGTGPVVGVLGFSQGACIGAGLLEQQQRQNKAGEKGYGLRFGIFCMPGYPIVRPSKGPPEQPEVPRSTFEEGHEGEITIPSIHLHGLQDPYIESGRRHYRHFDPSTTKLFEMNLEHRLPITPEDNDKLCNAIIELYQRTAPSAEASATA